MSKNAHVLFIISLVLVIPVLSGQAASQAASYMPAVTPGQWAKYQILTNTCQPAGSALCMIESSLAETDYGVLQVFGVEGTNVTLKLSTVSRSGAGSQQGVLVDVSSGTSNVTGFPQGLPGLQEPSADYLVLAGKLNATDGIWNTSSAPSINKTLTEKILGESRDVNFLNYASTYSIYGFQVFLSSGFAFDRLSGVVVEASFNYSTIGANGSFTAGMVDNNIWRSSSMPDFGLAVSPLTIDTSQGVSGNSTVSVNRVNGFSGTVGLTAVSSSTGITCSLSPSSLAAGGLDRSTLSCTGSSGSYTVIVRGESGYFSHSQTVTVIVAENINAPSSGQAASSLQMPFIYAGIGVAGIVASLAFIMKRRKMTVSSPTPGEVSSQARS